MKTKIERIKEKLAQLQKEGFDKYQNEFGISKSQFKMNPPLSEEEVTAFESKHGIILPEDYRSFLLEIGNGGLGPDYGILPLAKWNMVIDFLSGRMVKNYLSSPSFFSVKSQPKKSETNWIEKQMLPQDRNLYQGMITISNQGCTYFSMLVVSGIEKGHICYVDLAGLPYFFAKDKCFLDWYERWLDELLLGLDMHGFGDGIGGNEKELCEILNTAKEPELKIVAAKELRRRKQLSSFVLQRVTHVFETDTDSEVRAMCVRVLEKGGQKAIPFLVKALQDSNSAIRESAAYALQKNQKLLISSMMPVPDQVVDKWVDKAEQSQDGGGAYDVQTIIDRIRTALQKSVEQETEPKAFFAQTSALKEIGGLTIDTLISHTKSENERFRAHAAYLLGETTDPKAIEPVIALLHDQDAEVRLYVVQALSKLQAKQALPLFIALQKTERDPDVKSNIKQILKEWKIS